MTKQLIVLLLFVLIPTIALAKPPYQDINNEELIELQKKGVPVFDIRLAEEWKETGVIEGIEPLTFFQKNGSVHPLFMEVFTSKVGKDDPFVLICRSGSRTAAVANYLGTKGGYSKVYNVKKGMLGWLKAKKPVEKFAFK